MSLLSRFAVQSVTLERRDQDASDWEGAEYDDPEEILAVYDPSYSDLGVDNPERRAGSVLTETEVALRDRIEGQIVTQVIPRFHRDGTLEYYEVTL